MTIVERNPVKEREVLGYVYHFDRYQEINERQVDLLEQFLRHGIPGSVLVRPIRDHKLPNNFMWKTVIVLDPKTPVLTTQDGITYSPWKIDTRHFYKIILSCREPREVEEVREMVDRILPDRMIRLGAHYA